MRLVAPQLVVTIVVPSVLPRAVQVVRRLQQAIENVLSGYNSTRGKLGILFWERTWLGKETPTPRTWDVFAGVRRRP